MAIEVREVPRNEHAEAGRITAEAYREFVRPGETQWEDYLGEVADVSGRAGRTTVLVAVEEGRILGSATLELDGRIEGEQDDPLSPGEAHIRMLGVKADARGRGWPGPSCPPARTWRASEGASG